MCDKCGKKKCKSEDKCLACMDQDVIGDSVKEWKKYKTDIKAPWE